MRGAFYNLKTIRARKVLEVLLERSRRDEFKPVQIIQITGVCPEIRGAILNSGTTRVRKVVEVSLERSQRDKFKLISFIKIAGAGPEFRRRGFATQELLEL